MSTEKQRREAERRRLQRQAERRREQAARRKKTNLIISVVAVVVVVAGVIALLAGTSGGDDKPSAAYSGSAAPSTPAVSSSAARTPTYPCDWTKAQTTSGKTGITAPKSTTPPKTGAVDVSVRTTQGSMAFTLNRALAPCTVASFVSLVQQGYYDKTPCHRLVTQGIYVLQCGDPTGQGTGGPGYSIPDEATGSESYPAGTIAMARSQQAHSGGSQFFIVYKDSPSLKQGLGQLQYTVFGTVSSGLKVVDKVAAGGVATTPAGGTPGSTTDGTPKLGITLTKLALAK